MPKTWAKSLVCYLLPIAIVGMKSPDGVLIPKVNTVMTHLNARARANCHIDCNTNGPAEPYGEEPQANAIGRTDILRERISESNLRLLRDRTCMPNRVKVAIAKRTECPIHVPTLGKQESDQSGTGHSCVRNVKAQ